MVLPNEQIYRLLDTVGDGSGTKSAIGNYSSAVEEFLITNPTRQIQIRRMLVEIRDTGLFSQERYGTIAALTNGIEVVVKDDSGTIQLNITDGVPIKSLAHWGAKCFDMSPLPSGSGDGFVNVRWTFGRNGSDILLPAGWSLVVQLNDDLTGLIDHTFFVGGMFSDGG